MNNKLKKYGYGLLDANLLSEDEQEKNKIKSEIDAANKTEKKDSVDVDENSGKKISRRKILGILAGLPLLASAADRFKLGKISELASEARGWLREIYHGGDRDGEFVEGGELTKKGDVLKFSIGNETEWDGFIKK